VPLVVQDRTSPTAAGAGGCGACLCVCRPYLDVLSCCCNGLLDELSHCLVVVTQGRLLQQGKLLLDLVQAALNNLHPKHRPAHIHSHTTQHIHSWLCALAARLLLMYAVLSTSHRLAAPHTSA
jgi:hypothetical protein